MFEQFCPKARDANPLVAEPETDFNAKWPFKVIYFGITEEPPRGYTAHYNKCGLRCEGSEDIPVNINEQRCSWTFKFCEVVRQWIWGDWWGGRSCFVPFGSLSENATVKELLKLVNMYPSYCKNKKGAILWLTVQIALRTVAISKEVKTLLTNPTWDREILSFLRFDLFLLCFLLKLCMILSYGICIFAVPYREEVILTRTNFKKSVRYNLTVTNYREHLRTYPGHETSYIYVADLNLQPHI